MTAARAHRRGRQSVASFACVLAVVAFAATTDAQRGRGRGGVSVMQLSIPAWPDGGMIPAKHAQAGGDVSPAISWTGTPEGAVSFVVVVRDVDAGNLLQWLVWNIPATSTGLPEGLPSGPEQENGVRQVSVSGPYYRGPAPPPTDPPHHYIPRPSRAGFVSCRAGAVLHE